MLQDPVAKPPDHMDMLACSRTTAERRQKANPHPEQPLNCPRCDSANTKFCYYNNYSYTQPRHFCKNCRRYWTKGGALRNVPIGGGCRKNKRVKQRIVDPTSLVSLDETTSNMLASINCGNCTSLLTNFSGPSSSSFVDLSNESHRFGLTFSRLQESLRLGEQSGAVPSNPGVYGRGIGSSEVATGLHSAVSCSQPSLIGSLPSFDTNLMSLGFPSSTVKPEHGVLYNGSDLGPLFETHTEMTCRTTTTTTTPMTSVQDQLSPYTVPTESFNEEAQMRHQQQLTLQLVNEGQNGDHGRILPAFEDETKENLRRVKGKSILSTLSEWQGMQESYYGTPGDSHFWNNNIGWTDFHPLASSAGGGML